MTSEQKEILAERRAEAAKLAHAWLAARFGIRAEDIHWFNSGICYDRVVVKTEAAAQKVKEAVRCEKVNGGFFDGMPLGDITPTEDGFFDVIC